MYGNDNELNRYNNLIQKIKKDDYPIPDEFNAKIYKTIHGLKRNRLNLRYVAVAGILVFATMFTTLNLFPSVAAYASNVPVLDMVVDWLVIDKGIQNAKSNGYKNLGPIIVNKDEYTLELHDIYFDDTRIRLSSLLISNKTFEGKVKENEDYKTNKQNRVTSDIKIPSKEISYRISFDDFKGLPCRNYSQGSGSNGVFPKRVELEIIDKEELLDFLDSGAPNLVLTATIYEEGEKIDEITDIKIPFKRTDILFSKDYTLNTIFSSEYGDISIRNLTISPTRMIINTKYTDKGDLFIIGFKEAYLRDDEGNIYVSEGNIVDEKSGNIREYKFIPSIYFNKSPKKLYFCYEGIKVGTKTGTTLKVNVNDNYPRTFKLMGKDIVLESVQWLDNRVLQIKMDCPEQNIFDIGSVLLLSGNKKTSSDRTSITHTGYKRIKRTEYYENVPCVDEYEIELWRPEYFIPYNGEIELNLN